MPNTGNCHHAVLRQNLVNNPIRRKNNLPDMFILLFRDNPSNLRKLGEQIHFRHESKTKRFRNRMILPRNEGYIVAQIIPPSAGPDYFESHAANCRLTSSCGTISPRSICSEPLRIAAKNSNRSAMVSSLASSGSRWIESNASSLSLIELVCANEAEYSMVLLRSQQPSKVLLAFSIRPPTAPALQRPGSCQPGLQWSAPYPSPNPRSTTAPVPPPGVPTRRASRTRPPVRPAGRRPRPWRSTSM